MSKCVSCGKDIRQAEYTVGGSRYDERDPDPTRHAYPACSKN
jgi:hypothetical protein